MGNRYGRKKRRQAREQIEALERHVNDQATAIRWDRALLSKQARDLADVRQLLAEWDDRIRSMLGSYTSASITDTTYRVGKNDEVRQMAVYPQMRAVSFEIAPLEDMVRYVEDVLQLIVDLEDEDRIDLSRRLRVELRHGDYPEGQAIFGMSRKYFQDLQRAGAVGVRALAPRLARDIARVLLTPRKNPVRRAG